MTTAAECVRTAECVQCHETEHACGMYTDPLGRRPGGEAICGPCLDHLDGKEWTKAGLRDHLDDDAAGAAHGNYIYDSRTTKQSMVRSHHKRHAHESERQARLLAVADTMTYLREAFACRLPDSGFAGSTDTWLAQHIENHKSSHLGATACSNPSPDQTQAGVSP